MYKRQAERATLRNKRIGFVFQNFNLLSRTTALENVIMPAVYAHPALSRKAMRERSVELLNLVGLSAVSYTHLDVYKRQVSLWAEVDNISRTEGRTRPAD